MSITDTKNTDKNELDIIIQTPKGNWETTFPKTTKISEVLSAVIGHFGFANNGSYELRLNENPNEALKPERTLISYQIKDGDILVFIDFGQAV